MNRKYNELAVELAKKMRYEYQNITWMLQALDSTVLPEKGKAKHYENTALALVGKNLLDLVISIHYYEISDSSTIVEKFDDFEDSEFIPVMADFYELEKYSYNQNGLMITEKTPFNKTAVFQAIAGAVYMDKGYDYALDWIKGKLFK